MTKTSFIITGLALLVGVQAACPTTGYVYCGQDLINMECATEIELQLISDANTNVLQSLYPTDLNGGYRRQVVDCTLGDQICRPAGTLSVDGVCNPPLD